MGVGSEVGGGDGGMPRSEMDTPSSSTEVSSRSEEAFSTQPGHAVHSPFLQVSLHPATFVVQAAPQSVIDEVGHMRAIICPDARRPGGGRGRDCAICHDRTPYILDKYAFFTIPLPRGGLPPLHDITAKRMPD